MKTGATGDLVKVLSDLGESVQTETSSSEQPQHIEWKKSPVESYFFCSKTKPASIDRIDSAWVASLLAPGNPDANPGSARDSYLLYLFVCHGRDFSKQVISDADVAAYNYPASLVDQAGQQQKLVSPVDIMDDYRSISFEDFKLDGKDLAERHAKVRLSGIYKKFGDLETLLPSALAVAAAREYGNNGGVPLLTDDATRTARKIFLECGDNPMRPLGCAITVLAHVDICTASNFLRSKSAPCLVVEDGQ